MIRRFTKQFIRNTSGQDLVEYSLIMAFVLLAGAAVYIGMSRNTQGLWTAMNGRLANANQTAGS